MCDVLIPPVLSAGDKVAVVSPSGIIDPVFVKNAVDVLNSWGLHTQVMPNVLASCGRYAGSVEQRTADLTQALTDRSVKAVFCSRGGYGAVHLLPFLPDALICSNPKWLIGFSDITLLLAAFLRCGIASLHAPMSRHLSDEGGADESVDYMRRILFGEVLSRELPVHSLNRFGMGEGRLIGGNLAVFCALRGTKYDYDFRGGILFVEDVGERPYQIERMMYNLKLGGVLAGLNGLVVGRFTGYDEDCSLGKTVYEMIAGMVQEYDYPVCFDFPVGHVKQNYPLIMGGSYCLTIDKDRVVLAEIRG